ncbi:hypothetical protein AB0M50_09530 [Nonomuraea fuscirosea]|uniref:hypothetical protein n=1 Tax=Nonomuraea fuscirosea TaxID=1291556 RepID=UPI003423853F
MRNVAVPAMQPQKRGGGLLSVLMFLAVVGGIVYAINDPVGAAHAIKAVFRAIATFVETLAKN